jgi:glycopeptide antibiotics resistance protein
MTFIHLRSGNLRIPYLLAAFISILLGLASRKYSHLIPLFLANNAGDTIWAMMVYFGFRFLFVKKSQSLSVLLSFLFSFGIEFSQMYQGEMINQIRGTLLGALILGKGFLTADLLRYTTGIIIAAVFDKMYKRYI